MPTRTGTFLTLNDQTSTCTCDWKELSSSERTKRALQYLASFWAGSIASILIPILHFVLVPGLFFGGIFVAYKVSKQNILIFNLQGNCPRCGTPQTWKKLVYQPDMKELCSNCKESFRVNFN